MYPLIYYKVPGINTSILAGTVLLWQMVLLSFDCGMVLIDCVIEKWERSMTSVRLSNRWRNSRIFIALFLIRYQYAINLRYEVLEELRCKITKACVYSGPTPMGCDRIYVVLQEYQGVNLGFYVLVRLDL